MECYTEIKQIKKNGAIMLIRNRTKEDYTIEVRGIPIIIQAGALYELANKDMTYVNLPTHRIKIFQGVIHIKEEKKKPSDITKAEYGVY